MQLEGWRVSTGTGLLIGLVLMALVVNALAPIHTPLGDVRFVRHRRESGAVRDEAGPVLTHRVKTG